MALKMMISFLFLFLVFFGLGFLFEKHGVDTGELAKIVVFLFFCLLLSVVVWIIS